MFSATWPQDVRALARDFQTEAVFLNVGSLDLNANHNIEQIVEVTSEYKKRNRLFQILEQNMDLVCFDVIELSIAFRMHTKRSSSARPSVRPTN